MIIGLGHYSENKESTLGLISLDGAFECYSLEDEGRKVKVPGETRIDDGIYEVGIREVVSPMTERYRAKFDWFDWHLWIKGLPRHEFVYLHIGSKDDHSDACVLVGDTANNNTVTDGFIGNSTAAYERFYKKVRPLIGAEKVYVKIGDLVL